MGNFQDGTAADIDRAVAAGAAPPTPAGAPRPGRNGWRCCAAPPNSSASGSSTSPPWTASRSARTGWRRWATWRKRPTSSAPTATPCRKITALRAPAARESRHHRNTSVLKPYGVWAVIAPFNFPMALSGGPTAAALVAGNTVVLKPAEDTPYGPTLLVKCLQTPASAAGRHQLRHRPEGDGRALVDHPGVDGITFTGSYAWAWKSTPRWRAGRKPAPGDHRDGRQEPRHRRPAPTWTMAAEGVVRAAFGLSGQKCSACSRVYVHADVKDAFVAQAGSATPEKVPGRRPDPAGVWMGPVINRRAYENYQAHVAELRAHGTSSLRRRHARPPTASTLRLPWSPICPTTTRCGNRRCSSPSCSWADFTDFDEALARANDVDFGLTAGCYSEDPGEVRAIPRQHRGRRRSTSTATPAPPPAPGLATSPLAAGRAAAPPAKAPAVPTTCSSTCANRARPSSARAAAGKRMTSAVNSANRRWLFVFLLPVLKYR